MLLQTLLQEDMNTVDPVFYARIKESALIREDRTVGNLFLSLPEQLFLDGDSPVKSQKSRSKSIPIYEIRRRLIEEDRPADLRYVYLAMEHILKHRGHFYFENMEPAEAEMEARHAVCEILDYYREKEAIPVPEDDETIQLVVEAICNKDYGANELTEALLALFRSGVRMDAACKAISGLLCGQTVQMKNLLVCHDADSDSRISFANEDVREIMDAQPEEESEMLYNIHFLYEWRQAGLISTEGVSLSAEMDALYKQHSEDLKQLKAWVRKYAGRDVYRTLFHDDYQPCNYNAYTGVHTDQDKYQKENWLRCTQKDFYSYLETILTQDYTDADEKSRQERINEAQSILNRMFTGDGQIRSNGFLPLQRTEQNRMISNQRQMQDLQAIVDHQAKYWPSVAKNRDKILILGSFRVPYYVGPLRQDSKSPFKPWIRYRERGEGHITPWNFEQRINLEETAEAFVEDRVSHCSFIPSELVLPRHSLLYQEYEVLDELNRIRVNGKLIKPTWKRALIDEVYCRYRHVTPGLIRKWFAEHTDLGEKIELSTTGGQVRRIRASLSTRIDMENIFGHKIVPDDPLCQDIEKIVRWSTIFQEKSLYLRILRKNYEGVFTPQQIQALANCRYHGWGRLSRMFLDGVQGKRGETPVTIIEVMRSSNQNLMKAYYSRKYGFAEAIKKLQQRDISDEITYDEIDALPCGPSVKRGIWMAIRVLREIEEVMKEKPASIFVRNMRDDNARRRQDERMEKGRYQRIRQMYQDYERLTGNTIEKALKDELSDRKRSMTDKEYLYFSQMGKCMYSGRRIRLEHTEEYSVDYIVPLSLLADMTMDNQVLVLNSENHRGEKDAMDDRVIQAMSSFWSDLQRAGLISGTKLHRLQMRSYDPELIRDYLMRQLLETSRISMTFTDVLKRHYITSHIYGINARLTQSIRNTEGLTAITDLNDMTQVFDAFLTAHMGAFADRYLANVTDESTRQSVLLDIWKRTHGGDKNGIILSAYNQDQEDEGMFHPEGLSASLRKEYVRSVYYWKDAFFTYMPVVYDGKFYRETIYRPGSHEGVPHRQELPADTYGVHINASTAWIAMVKYTYKDRQVKELISVPVHVAYNVKNNSQAVLDYAREKLEMTEEKGFRGLRIIKDRIRLNQEILIQGTPYYMISASEIIPARQLFLPRELLPVAGSILLRDADEIQEDADNGRITKEELDGLMTHLIDKMLSWHPVYKGICKQLYLQRDQILQVSPHDKAIIIRCLIYCMGTKRRHITPYLKMLHEKILKGENRILGRHITGETITLMDRSVTGIHSKRTVY